MMMLRSTTTGGTTRSKRKQQDLDITNMSSTLVKENEVTKMI
jgi:hypothetical protein